MKAPAWPRVNSKRFSSHFIAERNQSATGTVWGWRLHGGSSLPTAAGFTPAIVPAAACASRSVCRQKRLEALARSVPFGWRQFFVSEIAHIIDHAAPAFWPTRLAD